MKELDNMQKKNMEEEADKFITAPQKDHILPLILVNITFAGRFRSMNGAKRCQTETGTIAIMAFRAPSSSVKKRRLPCPCLLLCRLYRSCFDHPDAARKAMMERQRGGRAYINL
jgi:hypothetical protein